MYTTNTAAQIAATLRLLRIIAERVAISRLIRGSK